MQFNALGKKGEQILELSLPYGRNKMLLVFLVALLQGVLQVVGVTSIFPFLALAANPEGFMNSGIGIWIENTFPGITERGLLLWSGAFAIVALVASNGVLLLGEVVRARYVQGMGHWLRVRLLTRMMSNPYTYFLNRNTGELLKKAAGDVMAFINGILAPLLDLIARLIMVLLLLGTLLWINPLLTFLAGIGLGGFYVVTYLVLGSLRKRTSEGLKAANRGSMREAIQALAGIKPIKIHGVERTFLDRYGAHTAQQARLSKWIPVVRNGPRFVIEPIAFGGIVAVVLYYIVAGQRLQEILPVLGVMALAGYRLLPNLQLMYGAFSGISVQSHALEEIWEELEGPGNSPYELFPDARPPDKMERMHWERQFELRNIGFRYEGAEKPVLQGINIAIEKNQFVAFVGETGSGKSTLIDLILGLHRAEEGQILLDGKALGEGDLRRWRAGIGYVPQDIFLMDDTIASNIAFGVLPQEIDMERVREVAAAAQLKQFVETELPEGFATKVGERGVRLSGGQRQRIGLARALYHRPELLVLDEATSALDNQTEAALMKAIESLHGRMTLLVIAHRLTTIRNADLVVKLDQGRVLESGSYEEVVGAIVGDEEN